jgi:hypothetical protein
MDDVNTKGISLCIRNAFVIFCAYFYYRKAASGTGSIRSYAKNFLYGTPVDFTQIQAQNTGKRCRLIDKRAP